MAIVCLSLYKFKVVSAGTTDSCVVQAHSGLLLCWALRGTAMQLAPRLSAKPYLDVSTSQLNIQAATRLLSSMERDTVGNGNTHTCTGTKCARHTGKVGGLHKVLKVSNITDV